MLQDKLLFSKTINTYSINIQRYDTKIIFSMYIILQKLLHVLLFIRVNIVSIDVEGIRSNRAFYQKPGQMAKNRCYTTNLPPADCRGV